MGPGIGLSVARRFGNEGFRVALMSRNAASLESYKADLAATGIESLTLPTDAGDESSLVRSFQQLKETWGDPAVLLYNAVTVHPGNPSDLAIADLLADFRAGVGGALVALQQVVPTMKEKKEGTLLFTGGGFALQPYPSYSSLGVAKAAMRNLVASAATELKPLGIQVATLTVCGIVEEPGPFSPNKIAEAFWNLHKAPINSPFELLFTGQ
jgi:short-subunit dehydrogenase